MFTIPSLFQGQNAAIVYTITEATDVFQVDTITGVITVKDSALLDRETHDNISVLVSFCLYHGLVKTLRCVNIIKLHLP